MARKRKRRPTSVCANCGEGLPATASFCAGCGQANHDPRGSLRLVFGELIEAVTDLDNRVWLTLRTLLFRPGVVAVEYASGKRAKYVPPFRLFIVASAVYFLAASVFEAPRPTIRSGEEVRALQTASGQGLSRALDAYGTRLERDGETMARGELTALPFDLFRYLKYTVWLLLPFAAIAVWLVDPRPARLFVDALVFTLYSFSFLLLCGTSYVGLPSRPAFYAVSTVIEIGLGAWLFVASARFWGTRGWSSVWRFAAVAILCGLVFGLVFAAFLLWSYLSAAQGVAGTS